ncbi:hypothetical protein [Anaerosalibacter massiliensis]|uniref:ComK protein n=1 Tax=Anaerosalibacter massiliensis TaxID=1347392 RepID=A0A9X2MJM1_9FIRM|nr:hypothetical protein [Anaerosalibacter massiliensis]MCR2044723.1 hypothetical protein [Anaerosalibacter massiliensis]
MNIGKYVEEELMAFIPVYLNMKGNCTAIYTYKSGEIYIDKSLRSFLNCLGKYFLIDLKESRKHYGNLLNVNNLVPIPFNRENIFIPIKTRKPISRNDGALGYININYIDKIEEGLNGVNIFLKPNYKIKSLNTLKTVEKHINNGEIVRKFYDEREKGIYETIAFYDEYNKPATKGDIAILREELLKIKETLE